MNQGSMTRSRWIGENDRYCQCYRLNVMKIVYFNYLYDLYGASIGSTIKAVRLMKALAQCGHEVKMYWRKDQPSEDRTRRVKEKARIHLKKHLARFLHEPNQLRNNLRYLREEYAILKKEKPDLLITRLDIYIFSSMLLAKCLKLPVILEADSPEVYEFLTFNKEHFKTPWLLEAIEQYNLRRADACIVVSNMLANYFRKQGLDGNNLYVIPNGADPSRFHPNVLAEPVRQRYGLQNKLVIGFIGSFHYWHGVENLMALLQPALKRDTEVNFLLVGEGGPLKPRLQEFIRQNNLQARVHMTGYVEHAEVPQHVAAMDIVLAPYPRLEFFYYSPVKIYEYMACGKPVVASRLGQIAEIIEDGVNGLLSAPGDIASYVNHLYRLIENADLRERIGRNAYQTILLHHSWSARGKECSKICEQVVNANRNKANSR